MKIFNDYIKEIKEVKDQLEHSGRTFLQNLLINFTDKHKINIIHESKRDKQGRGAPDFKFLFNDTEIGYLENAFSNGSILVICEPICIDIPNISRFGKWLAWW